MKYFPLAVLLLLVCIINLGFPTTTYAAIGTVPSYGLVGHWPLDDGIGTTATDTSNNGNTATLVNGPTWVAGVAGDALNFASTTGSTNARNYLTFPAGLQNTSFPTTGSLSFWIKGNFTQQNNLSVFSGNASGNHIFVRTKTTSGLQIALEASDGTYLNQTSSSQYLAPGISDSTLYPVTTNAWNHIVIAWDSTNKMGYVYENGTMESSFFWGSATTTWTPSAQSFQLNNPIDSLSSTELIDDIALYNRILSPTEVQDMYTGAALPSADTVAPSAPSSVVTSGISPSQVGVGWSASTDNVALGGYVIYRNGSPVGEVGSTTLSYLDSSLATSTSYSYTVRAYDSSGNQSTVSNTASGSTTSASILSQTDFEEDFASSSSATIDGWTRQNAGGSSYGTVSTDQSRAGSNSMKFNFNYSDWSTATTFDLRNEIAQTSPFVNFNLGQTYWVGFSEYLPANWGDDYANNPELIYQFHGTAGGPGGNGSPPLSLNITNDEEDLSVLGAATTTYDNITNFVPQKTIYTASTSPDKGKWTDWVLEVNFNYTGGIVNAWKNGTLVTSFTGPTIYHATSQTLSTGPYFKIGDYKWNWGNDPTLITNRTLYADEIRMGTTTANCSTVMPTGSASCTSVAPTLTTVQLASNDATSTIAKSGDTVTLYIASNQATFITPTVTIQGHMATVVASPTKLFSIGGQNLWSASTNILSSDPQGPVTFSASVGNADGTATTTVTSTTDGSQLTIPDTIPPIVSVIAPASLGTVSGSSVILSASSTDNISIAGVTFYLDGGKLGSEIASLSTIFSTIWNSITVAIGTHSLVAVSRDTSNNYATSTAVSFVVNPIGGGAGGAGGSSSSASVVSSGTPTQTSSSSSSPSVSETKGNLVSSSVATVAPITPAAASSTPQYVFIRSLSLYQTNLEVRALQQLLAKEGFFKGPTTGYFGPLTKSAVIAYQKAQSLPATGYVGPLTLARLNQKTSSHS